MRARIGRDVPEEDDAFGIEAVDEGGEAVPSDVADGQHQGLDPRRGDGEERIGSHRFSRRSHPRRLEAAKGRQRLGQGEEHVATGGRRCIEGRAAAGLVPKLVARKVSSASSGARAQLLC